MQTLVALKTIESVHPAAMTDRIRHIQNAGGSKVATCTICQKGYKNTRTLKSHVFDCHDNEAKRTHPLKCVQSSCTSSYLSRHQCLRHIRTCTGNTCSSSTAATLTINEEENDAEAKVRGAANTVAETWVEAQVEREVEAQGTVENVPKARVTIQVEVEEEGEEEEKEEDEEDEEERGERFERLQGQLIAATRSRYTAEFLLNLTEPVAIHLKSGETENMLALPGGVKRLLQDMVVSVRPVKRRTIKGNSVQDGELRSALAAYAFGAFVDTVSMVLRSPTRFLVMSMKI